MEGVVGQAIVIQHGKRRAADVFGEHVAVGAQVIDELGIDRRVTAPAANRSGKVDVHGLWFVVRGQLWEVGSSVVGE